MIDYNLLPKTDLHLHLDGALKTETIFDLASEQDYALGVSSVEELDRLVKVSPQCKTLSDFLKTFTVYYPLLQTPTALARAAAELVQDLARQNVIYAEIRYAPILSIPDALKGDAALEAMAVRAQNIAQSFYTELEKNNMHGGIIFCCMREFSVDSAHQTLELLQSMNSNGKKNIVAMDLAGDESRFSNEDFAPVYKKAHNSGIAVTIHAAEAAGPESARNAIDLFHARRIGHGIKIEDDQTLLNRIIKDKIALEICLTSNLQTGTVPDLASHPFKRYLDQGVAVTLNTDDPGVSGIDISYEWKLAVENYGLNSEDVKLLLLNSVEHAFCTDEVKQVLKENVKSFFFSL